MNIRINEKISIETDIPFQSIQELAMTWEINDHARVNMSGILKGKEGVSQFYLRIIFLELYGSF